MHHDPDQDDDERARDSAPSGDSTIGPLASGLAHELNNIFGIILGNAELAVLTADIPESVRLGLEEITKAGRHGQRVVQQMLAFSRRRPVAPTTGEWHDVVEETARLLRSSIPAGLELELVLRSKGSPAPVSSAATGAEAIEPPPAPVAAASGRHIFYLDDEEPMVRLAERMLARLGFRVSGFVRPERALAALKQDPSSVDLIVTDYNMPRISGIDVAREAARLRPDLPVMVTSGYISDEMREKAAGAGVAMLVEKPDTMDALCEMIAKAFSERA